MLAFTSQFVAIPTYHQLENHSQEGFAQKSCTQYLVYIFVFLAIGLCGAMLFGAAVDVDLMVSLANHPGLFSLIGRICFCMVLMCHIPYYFKISKVCSLVIYDEMKNESMSQAMESKIASFDLDSDEMEFDKTHLGQDDEE